MFSETGHGFPIVTNIFSMFTLLVVIAHGAVALRRFPAQIGQWRALRRHMNVIKRKDSHAWLLYACRALCPNGH